ncbi:MAG: carboxypeptidase-like regulatory domain-containing protein, partial [Bacteroidota bacterium]
MKPSKKHIDQKIKKKVEDYEFDFSDHAWDKMEQLMDRPAPPTRSNHLFNFRNFTIMILLLIILYLGVQTLTPENVKLTQAEPNPSTTELKEATKAHPIPQQTLDLSDPLQVTTKKTTRSNDLSEETAKKKIAQAELAPNTLPEAEKTDLLGPEDQNGTARKSRPSQVKLQTIAKEKLEDPPIQLSRSNALASKDSLFFQSLSRQLAAHNQHYRPEKVYLQLDRTWFRPGESLWFNAFLRDANSLKASKGSEIVYVELNGPNGANLRSLTLVAQKGQAKGDFLLPSDAVGGQYTVKAYTNWQKNQEQFFERTIQVQNSIIPKLRMELDFVREAYGPGDEVEAEIDLKGLDNKALSKHAFRFAAMLDGQLLSSDQGKTDKQGKAPLRFRLPPDLTTKDGLLNVVIEYRGQNESIARSIPIVLNTIDLQFLPEGGELLSGFPAKVAFKALNEFGEPADVEGAVFNSKGEQVAQFRSYHQGMGAFDFVPQEGEHYFARINRPKNIEQDYAAPKALSKGYGLQVEMLGEDQLAVKVNSTVAEELYLVVHTRGQIYHSRSLQAEVGTQSIRIPVDQMPIGIAQVTLFDNKEIPRAERLVFLHPNRRLDIAIQTDKEQYQPREKVKMTVEVKDERGIPMPGQFSLAVVSDNLLTHADDKQGNILAYLLLESDLQGKVVEPNFYFDDSTKHPQKDQVLALDYLMLTQGWRCFGWQQMEDTPLMAIQHQAESALVSGIVLDERRQPLADALVKVQGTDIQTFSQADGSFEIRGLTFYDGNVDVVVQKEDLHRQFEVTRYQEGKRIQLHKSYSENLDIAGLGTYSIRGKVTDKESGEALIGATVYIEGTATGTLTDFDGNYAFHYLPQGEYNLQVAYIGYEMETITCYTEGSVTRLDDIAMDVSAISLSEVIVAEYKVPLIEQDNTTTGAVITSGRVKTLPQRDIATIAATTAGLVSADEGDQVTIRGSRSYPIDYYLDGVRVTTKVDAQNKRKQAMKTSREGEGSMNWEEAKRMAESAIRSEGPERLQTAEMNAEQIYALNFRKGYYRARQFYQPKYEAQSTKTKISRDDFRPTVYWNPEVNIDRNGRAELEFFTSDEMTTFRATLEGLTSDGSIGRKAHFFYSQLPFGMDVKVPHRVLSGDAMTLPLILSNHTSQAIEGHLTVQIPDAFQLQKEIPTQQKLAAGESKTIYLPLLVEATQTMDAQLDVNFRAEGYADAFQQSIQIVPRGFPVEAIYSGVEQEQVFSIDLKEPIEGSVSASFQVHADLSGDLMAGMERMLRQPSGCFEQTSSANYPNVLVLDYLESTQAIRKDIQKRAMNYLRKGYHRLTGFEVKGGGFDWYGEAPAHEALTAYGLLQFVDMKAVFPVDLEMLERNSRWLLSRRDGKGSWQMNDHFLHTWDRDHAIADAYIVWALFEAGMADELDREIDKSYADALASKDPYVLALMANALYLANDKRAETLMDILLPLQTTDGHWTGLRYSMTQSRGQSLKIETTALVALAILKAQEGLDRLEAAIRFIQGAKSQYGFGSTQSTVSAMKALVAAAKFKANQWRAGEVQLSINGKRVLKEQLEREQNGTLTFSDLGRYLKMGANQVSVKFSKKGGQLPYDF